LKAGPCNIGPGARDREVQIFGRKVPLTQEFSGEIRKKYLEFG